jgi:two-component system KDP operon response regulator KdpE
MMVETNLPPANIKAGTILVIDDNPIIRRTTYFALRDQGYNVLMAGEIAEALKILRHEHLDAVLLDLNFPPDASVGGVSMSDGFWALDWMKRMHEVRDIPVVVISSDAPEKSKAQAMASGAAAYFQKPIDKQALIATVATLLSKKTTVPGA